MNRFLSFSLTVGALGLVALTPASGQSGRDRGPEGRVVLFADANFSGPFIVLYPGDRIDDFAHLSFDTGDTANDHISSVRIEGPLELWLYVDSHYRGDALHLRESIANLANEAGPSRRGNWNDLVSSATVTAAERRPPAFPRPAPGDGGRPHRRGPRIELYSDANYSGTRLVLRPGERVPNLADATFEDGTNANDRISSIRLLGGAALIAHSDADFRGHRLLVDASIPNLDFRYDRPNGRSWNDTLSSLAATTRQAAMEAEEIIEEAYRELLGRAPDEAMLAHYTRALQAGTFTEADLRNEIRRSREYRVREAEIAVHRAYRELLQRDPDPEGLAAYMKAMVEQGWSEARVREAIRRSDEYRQRPPQT